MSNFMKKLLQFCIGPISSALINIIMIPLTTYFVVPEALGKASMFTLVQTLFVATNLGLDQAYTREYHVEGDKQNLLLNAMILPIVLSVIVFTLFATNVKFFSSILFDETHYHLATYLTGFSAITMCIERFVLLKIRLEEKGLEYSFFIFVSKGCLAVVTMIIILFIRTDFLAIIYATIIAQFTFQLALFFRQWKIFDLSQFKLDQQLNKKLLLFGLPLVLSILLGSLLKTAANISLRLFSDFEQMGLFMAGSKLVNLLMVIQTAFTVFWVPTAYRWHEEDRKISDYKLVSDAILAVMSFSFLLLLFSRPLFVVVISERFKQAQYFISFLSFYPIMYTLASTTKLGIVFARKSYLNIIVNFVSLCSNVLLNFLLTPSLGALGAAIAISASYIVYFLIFTFLSFRLWQGFSIKRHLFVVFLMFSLAVIDLLYPAYNVYVKISMTIIFLLIQREAIHNIIKIGIGFKTKKSKSEVKRGYSEPV